MRRLPYQYLIIPIVLFALFVGCNGSNEVISSSLFQSVSSSASHVTFNNVIEDRADRNIMIYSNYYGGAGVGIGDLNNDGLPDMYFAGNLVSDELYINKGDMVFDNITSKSGISDNGGWSSGVLIADVNQDGYNDIYVTRELYDDQPELRRNLLYINDGNGSGTPTFTEQAATYHVDDNQRTRHATYIDYDKDGDLDLFLLNQPPNPGDYSKHYDTDLLIPEYRPRLLEYTGAPKTDGSGGFVDVSLKAGFDQTGFPNSVTASDLNGDGWTDLYVANDFEAGDWYYINNGDGTFTDKAQAYVKHTSFSSMGVDAADMNNDGLLDVSIVDMAAEDNYRSKTNMSGMNPKAFWKVVDDGGHHQYMFNALQMNTGDGHMSDMAQLGGIATTDWSWSILMADFDNDQWKDVFITNGLYRDIRNNDASKAFPKYLESEIHKHLQNNPNDIEGKNIWDIVDIDSALAMVPSEKLQNFIYKNEGNLTFSKKIKEWGLEEKTFSNGAAYADLDNDGDLDLVVNNINDIASIYRNTASESKNGNYLRINPIPQKGRSTQGVKCWIKTKDEMQFAEVASVRGMYSTSESTLHFGLANNKIVDEVKLQWPDGKINTLTNVDANQILTIDHKKAIQGPSKQTDKVKSLLTDANQLLNTPYRHQENKYDDYKSQVLLPHKMSTSGPLMATGDINGDGLEDLFIGGAISYAGAIYIQENNGTFSLKISTALNADTKHEDTGAELFDADGDGDLDLYVVSGGNESRVNGARYEDRLYINDGSGNFNKENNRLPEFSMSGSKVRSADFDKDGDLDLFIAGRHVPWAYPEPASSALLVNDGGKFSLAPNDLSTPLKDLGLVNDAQWTDYNNDGWIDLVVTGEWMPITLLENKEGKAFTKSIIDTDLPTEGWWFSVTTADMDGDGDEDIIAGNLGLNYKYKANPTEPFEVYYGDFDNNKSKDIVLTYYNYGISYPLRGKQCSSEQIPELNDKIPTYDLFASSDVESIYGTADLENALHLRTHTFSSTYFENLGDGSFKAKPLPNLAQISSINDILIDDYNADGHLDILIAGNLYNAEVETTRNDAGYGLLLKGNSKGDFDPMTRKESGFFVPYNVKSLASMNRQSDQLIFVGCNDDQLRVYRIGK